MVSYTVYQSRYLYHKSKDKLSWMTTKTKQKKKKDLAWDFGVVGFGWLLLVC